MKLGHAIIIGIVAVYAVFTALFIGYGYSVQDLIDLLPFTIVKWLLVALIVSWLDRKQHSFDHPATGVKGFFTVGVNVVCFWILFMLIGFVMSA
jgi:hypothetical protein